MGLGKDRGMALFIGIIMVSSMVGFAIMNVQSSQEKEDNSIGNIVKRPLEDVELSTVLRTGRVVIRDHYTADCERCLDNNIAFESFAMRYGQYVVLEEVLVQAENQTVMEMIGSGGQIQDLSGMSINQDTLLRKFCDVAIAQPRECILLQV